MLEKKIIKVKGVEIGAGIPKICVSITGRTKEEIFRQGNELAEGPVEIAEWRADYYNDIFDKEETRDILLNLPKALKGKPLLFTFRRKEEGGERAVSVAEYSKINQWAVESGGLDLVDIELSAGDEAVKKAIETAKKYGVKTVVSSHDFKGTPKKEEMLNKLKKMQRMGGDMPKIAVMPNNPQDVADLLAVTEEFERCYANGPFVTIAMARLGLVTRLSGGIFGSAMTFGSIGEASAPGQIEAKKLKAVLELLGSVK